MIEGCDIIRNGTDWVDTDGRAIVAHDGGISQFGDAFYWYGTSYEGNPTGRFGLGAPFGGFNVYRSANLQEWTFLGKALERPERGWLTLCSSHRAHVLHNESTGRYVMWFTYHPKHPAALLMVAVADCPEGPFELLGPRETGGPWGMGADTNVFKDANGTAYVLYDDGRFDVRIDRLSDDYLASTKQSQLVLPRLAEAPAMARLGGRYIIAGSGVHGWRPTETQYVVADSPMGPYSDRRIMSRDKTWRSQITDLVAIERSGRLMAMCDQWFVPEADNLNRSRYLWLPVTFEAETSTADMVYTETWDPLEPL